MRTLAVVALAFLPLVSVQAQNVYWALTNATASGNWSVGANWVGSAAPTTANSAYFASTNIQSYNITNDVTANNTGTSNYIQDLVFDLASGSVANAGETKNLNILPGTTLAVLGPNGFIITRDAPGVKDGNTHNILGNSLVVNNNKSLEIFPMSNITLEIVWRTMFSNLPRDMAQYIGFS